MRMNAWCRVTMRLAGICLLFVGLEASAPGLVAQDATFTNSSRFAPRDGETLYRSSCQACHMAAGQGAAGAGMYPALAKNAKLRTSRYVSGVVVRGQKGMPPFAGMMDDEQIAAVVNYVRTHFDNSYTDAVTAADVKALR